MTNAAAPARVPGRAALVFILVTILIDAIGIGLIFPVLPGLIEEVSGEGLSRAAEIGGLMAAVFALMQFLCGPVMGALSDRYGRRPVLLISLAVMVADYVVMALAGAVWLLFLGRVIGGIAAATQATAAAFVADISAPEEKAARFGLVGAAFGMGFVIGPALGGLLGELGTRAPFWAAGALAAANLLLGALVLPETVRTPRAFEWRRAQPFGAIARMRLLPGLGALLLIVLLHEVAGYVYPAIWAYYGPAAFGWTPATVGLSLASFGIAMAVVQGALVGPFIRILGERGTVLFGLAFDAVIYVILTFTRSGLVVLILCPVSALGMATLPALQGRMSRRVADDAQGELQGVLTSMHALAAILSPVVMTRVFAAFTTPPGPFLPGAPFFLSAIITLACIAIWLARPRPEETP